MLIVLLIVLNLPVYFLLGWLLFERADRARRSSWHTVTFVMKQALVPPLLQFVIWDGEVEYDPDQRWRILGFLAECAIVTFAEWHLLTTYVLA